MSYIWQGKSRNSEKSQIGNTINLEKKSSKYQCEACDYTPLIRHQNKKINDGSGEYSFQLFLNVRKLLKSYFSEFFMDSKLIFVHKILKKYISEIEISNIISEYCLEFIYDCSNGAEYFYSINGNFVLSVHFSYGKKILKSLKNEGDDGECVFVIGVDAELRVIKIPKFDSNKSNVILFKSKNGKYCFIGTTNNENTIDFYEESINPFENTRQIRFNHKLLDRCKIYPSKYS
jgi:hypothetical protein